MRLELYNGDGDRSMAVMVMRSNGRVSGESDGVIVAAVLVTVTGFGGGG